MSAPPAVPKLVSEGWVHRAIQDSSSLCWGYFFPHSHCNVHFMGKCARRKGRILADGGEQIVVPDQRRNGEWSQGSGEGSSKGQGGAEQLLSPATSLTPDRLLPALLLLPFPSVSGFGSSCRKKLSDSDGLIILLKIQQQQNEQGWVDVLCHHGVLGRERGQAAPRLPALPGASAGSEHIVRAQGNLLEKKQFQVNGLVFCSARLFKNQY